MTPLPLEQIGLHWRHHRSALWWLGILYRRPQHLQKALAVLPKLQAFRAGALLYIHALPYIVILSIIGRLFLFGIVDLEARDSFQTSPPNIIKTQFDFLVDGIYFGITYLINVGLLAWLQDEVKNLSMIGIISRKVSLIISIGILLLFIIIITTVGQYFGIFLLLIFSIASGIIVSRITNKIDSRFVNNKIVGIMAYGLVFTLVFGIHKGITSNLVSMLVLVATIGVTFGIDRRVDVGLASGIAEGIFFGIFYGLIIGIADGIVLGLGNGVAIGITVGIAIVIAVSRAYYYPLYLFFTWPAVKGQWYPWHPVAWDDMCALPFPRLDRLLVAYADHAPTAAQTEIERLIDHYPIQRMAALRAKTRLIARASAQEGNLSLLDAHVAQLPEGDRDFLAWTPKIREAVNAICQLQMRLDTLNRPFLRDPTAALLVEKIRNFQSQVAGFPEPLATEFRQAASQWLVIAERQHRQIQTVLTREPTPTVFRAGYPVDRTQEAFILRESVLGDLDRQLTLATGCPGLILYGRRRMGKSTLLRNLEGFLPTTVQVAIVSMQDPNAFSSQADFLSEMARQALQAIQLEQGRAESVSTLKDFFQLLTDCNARLAQSDRRLLLAIDEYENMDRKLAQGVFSEDLLSTMRESIQTHRRITWIFAGSHAITELKHAPWPSYLVSARTLEVPPFTEAETRRLLTEPLRYSSLWQDNDSKRPRFSPDFWGNGGIERIHAEAGGWPHLVQLLAETTVDLCNDREQSQADQTLLEQAINKAIVAGDTVLSQLMQPEDAAPCEWEYLRGFRTRDEQPPPDDEAVYQALRRRLLVTESRGQWRLRVPLMQRWLRKPV